MRKVLHSSSLWSADHRNCTVLRVPIMASLSIPQHPGGVVSSFCRPIGDDLILHALPSNHPAALPLPPTNYISIAKTLLIKHRRCSTRMPLRPGARKRSADACPTGSVKIESTGASGRVRQLLLAETTAGLSSDRRRRPGLLVRVCLKLKQLCLKLGQRRVLETGAM